MTKQSANVARILGDMVREQERLAFVAALELRLRQSAEKAA